MINSISNSSISFLTKFKIKKCSCNSSIHFLYNGRCSGLNVNIRSINSFGRYIYIYIIINGSVEKSNKYSNLNIWSSNLLT